MEDEKGGDMEMRKVGWNDSGEDARMTQAGMRRPHRWGYGDNPGWDGGGGIGGNAEMRQE
jgi:hypothetical protein